MSHAVIHPVGAEFKWPKWAHCILDWDIPGRDGDYLPWLVGPVTVGRKYGMELEELRPADGVQLIELGWIHDDVEDWRWDRHLGWTWHLARRGRDAVLIRHYGCRFRWRYRPSGFVTICPLDELPEELRPALQAALTAV